MKDPKIEAMIRETHRLAQENHKMLKKIDKTNRRDKILRYLKWAVVLAALFGAYYLVQPLIQNLQEAYTSIFETLGEINEAKDSVSDFGQGIKDLF